MTTRPRFGADAPDPGPSEPVARSRWQAVDDWLGMDHGLFLILVVALSIIVGTCTALATW